MNSEKIEALLFDLGGVLVEIDFARAFRHWQPLTSLSADEMKSIFYFDSAYEQHERGEIDAKAYFAHLRSELKLEGSDEEIAAGWNAIFIATIPATLAAIAQINDTLPCYAFTNTNAAHQAAWSSMFPEVAPLFKQVFSSWQLGLRKPEQHAFAAVVETIGVAPSSILFFDDTLENITEAKRAGLKTVHVTSAAETCAALSRL
jgi:glucose-1-phosphatase